MITTNSSDSSSEVGPAAIPAVRVTVDSKGRVRASKEQRREILEQFEHSRVSAVQFAKLTGLKYSTLAGWLQRYRRGKPARPRQPVRLLEAVVEPANDSGAKIPTALVVELPGGARLEIGDVKQVALASALLRSLSQSC